VGAVLVGTALVETFGIAGVALAWATVVGVVVGETTARGSWAG
jgi:hypothetical protein